MKKSLLLFCVTLLTISNVFAVDYYWVGGTAPSASFRDRSNWSSSGVGGAAVGTSGTNITFTTSDVLIIDGSDVSSNPGLQTGIITVTGADVNITIGQLKLTNSADFRITNLSTTRSYTVGGGLSGDDLDIQSGCQFIVGVSGAGTSTQTLALSANNTARIAGTLDIGNAFGSASVFTIGTAGNATVTSTGTYVHGTTAAAIPIFVWNTGATCLVTGIVAATSMTAANMSQAFHHFTWNCPNQTNTCNWQINDGSTIAGNLTLQNTGSGKVRLSGMSGSTPKTINISGNYIQTGGLLEGTGSGATGLLKINIGGNLELSAGTLAAPALFFVAAGTPVEWNMKNFILSNGSTSKGSGIVTLNVDGNFSMDGTSHFLSGGSGLLGVNFIKSGIATFSKTASSVILNNNNPVTFLVKDGCLINMGASVLNSTSTASKFEVESGGGLITANSGGIALTGATGSIQTSATTDPRLFSTGATYIYNGTSAQITGTGLPSTALKLVIDNTAGVTLSNAVLVTDSLKIMSGTLNTGSSDLTLGIATTAVIAPNATLNINGGNTNFADRPVILQSSNSGSGSIAKITGIISGASNVTTQGFIPGGRRAYRFLGHPFTNTLNMNALLDDIYVTGAGAGFDATATNNPSAFWYNNASTAWSAFTSATDASWIQHRGIRVLVRGDRTQPTTLTGVNPTPNPVTLDITGELNTGNQDIVVQPGYNLISNPYPSAVNIGQRLFSTTNIGTQYWVWDANAGPTAGAYVTRLVANTPYNLAMNGAFVVEPTNTTTINFIEDDKVATPTANLFRTSTTASGILELQVLYNNYPADNLYVRFNNNATDSKEALDGGKLLNPEVNFYAISADNQKLSLDTRVFNNNKIIPLGFTATAANTFTIKVADLGIAEEVYLKDKLLNVETKIDATNSYTFSVDPGNPNSLGNDRFELVFRTAAALPTNFVNVAAQQKGSAIEVTFTTANESNMDSYEVEESKDGTSFTKGTTIEAKNAANNKYSWLDANIHNGNNYYRVKAIEKNGAIKYSQVVRVNVGKQTADFAVYPNPVKGGLVNLQLTDIDKGIYTVKIYNNIGQEIATKTINHNGGSTTQSISIGNVPTGKYNMLITNGTSTVTKTVIVE